MEQYYPSIQILRAVLFLLILAFHCNVPYANFGWGIGSILYYQCVFSYEEILGIKRSECKRTVHT